MDEELLEAFECGTLTAFPHELHVRVARRLAQEPDGYERMSATLRRMGGSKYHETITRAWWTLIVQAERDLHDRGLLSRYYSKEALASGREHWVEPDLRPF